MDEIAYLFQAKVFASGALEAPSLEPRAAFNMWFIDDRGARFSIFPPGWPLFLALGVRLGVPRLVNPLLHFATVLLVGRAGERLAGPRAAVSAALLYAACPQTVILAASLMSHTLVAACAAVVLVRASRRLVSGARRTVDPSRSSLVSGRGDWRWRRSTRPLLRGRDRCCRFSRCSPSVAALRRCFRLVAAAPFLCPVRPLQPRAHRLRAAACRRAAYFDEHLAPADVPFFTYGPGCNALGFGRRVRPHRPGGEAHAAARRSATRATTSPAWLILIGPIVTAARPIYAARTA